MHHFAYREHELHAESVAIDTIAQSVGTPFYCYSTATLLRHYQVFSEAFSGNDTLVCYALKANSSLAVIRTLASAGAGADVVSEGEIRRALAAGVSADKIVFSGVGKTKAEMAFALESGIFSFNVESEAELQALNEVAVSKNHRARIAIRINPDVDAKTHAKISTGKSEHKFGVSWQSAHSLYDIARTLPSIKPEGVHMHIGSQITDVEPFRNAFELLTNLVEALREGGHEITFVNLGGGLGIPYRHDLKAPPHPNEYAKAILTFSKRLRARLVFEPGRIIAGNAGILVTRVIYTKQSGEKQFVIVDAGMNDLIRPTLYDAYHEILPVREPLPNMKQELVDVVGPVCETGDFFAKDRHMPPVESGDLVAIMTAGAYGAVQSSTYNSRLLIPEVLVSGERYAVTRERPTYDDMVRGEMFAPWQKSP